MIKTKLKNLLFCIAASSALLLSSCRESKPISRISIGKIVDVNVVPTAFNEARKMQIKTQYAVVIIYEINSIPLGAEVTYVVWDDGHHSIWIEGNRGYICD